MLLQVSHCHDSVVYVLAPLKYVSVFGCSDSIIVLGAVGKVIGLFPSPFISTSNFLIIVFDRIVCLSKCRNCLLY